MSTPHSAGAAPTVLRGFLQVGQRQVHYRCAGHGPPALLIHSSPTNSAMLLPELQALGGDYTCYAFDTPGFGLSDPLPLTEMTVADLADALAANCAALGLPACPVFGTHTGAAIALELAVRHPQQVTGIALDGLPVFTDAECAALLDAARDSGSALQGYFEPFPADELGGHFSRVWTRFRDQSMWFPWFDRRPHRLNAYDLPGADNTHAWTMLYYDAAPHYKPAYRAALSYGARALAALTQLRQPAVFTASATDMLEPHLARITGLRADQPVEGFGSAGPAGKHALVRRHFARFGSPHQAPPAPRMLASTPTILRQFVDLAHGQLHLRYCGELGMPPLLLLHDAPGSARALEALILALSRSHFVIAPDLPGCGESPPLPGGQPGLGAYADAMLALWTQLGLAPASVYGIGFGASLALALAQRPAATFPLARLVLRGLLLPDPAQRAELAQHYAPPIVISADGSHWYRTWLMLRDSLAYWPWFDRRYRNTRRSAADSGAQRMHDWTVDVMKQHASYQHLIEAALGHDAAVALAAVTVPLEVIEDAAQPFAVWDAQVRLLAPAGTSYVTV